MSYTFFTLAELREIANDPDRVENMFRWIRPNHTWFEPKNLRVTPFDADEIRARPFELSSDGEQVLLDKTYFVVDKGDGSIEEVSLLDMCERCDIDPVECYAETIPEWVDALDARIMQVSMKGVDWIEFRTEDEARECVAEDVAKRVSLDNGLTFLTADEAIDDIESRGLWDVVVNAMDDDVREDVHNEIAPCTNKEFLERYLVLAYDDLVI